MGEDSVELHNVCLKLKTVKSGSSQRKYHFSSYYGFFIPHLVIIGIEQCAVQQFRA